MQTRRFGKTNFDVSVLGFGAAPAAFLNTEPTAAAALVNLMLDAGVNLLDTAAMYPGSEAFIGEHLAHRRDDYILVSKCGTKVSESTAAPWTPQLVADSVERALKLLKTDVIDVMLLHSCDLATLQKGDALAELVKARDAGKIRHVGYSGDNEAAAFAAGLPDVAVIETSINIVDQVNIDTVLPAAGKNDIGVIVKRPIANACWRPKEAFRGFYGNYAKPYIERFDKMNLSPEQLGFAGDDVQEHWPEIAIRFTLSFPEVSTAIIGTTNPANAQANLGYVARGPLPSGAVETLRSAFRAGNTEGKWTGQT
ncbi:MAG TPA: aldo/keto reductase [Tepidisphaeraceae bacterium]|nr:aldo/keto reductase [Tepidisphaeraceae bacterium]